MKKRIIVTLLVIMAIAVVSCDKYCTCTTENGSSSQSIEIKPDQSCSDYSEGNMTCH